MANKNFDNLDIIIGDCILKNAKAQEALYKEFYGYAISVALLYTTNREEAGEIVNDSFMKVFSEIRKLDNTKSFKAWFRKIVINTAIDKFRRNLKHKDSQELPMWLPSCSPGALSTLTASDIISMVSTLPPIHKVVFCLYDVEGFDHKEIAKRIGIPESSSRVYLTRARKRLRELYEINFND